jgi:hypothetical protein
MPEITLASSLNPAGYQAPVTLTATLSPTNATGTVIFEVNGIAFATNTLESGIAVSPALASLPRGTNLVTVSYSGDSNILAGTNTLEELVTNHPPMAAVINVTRTAGLKLRIFFNELTNHWSDADGDTMVLVGLSLTTSNNVTLSTNGTQILYTNSANVADQITYTISDGQGGTNTGVINIVINPFVTSQSSLAMSNGVANLTFYGMPGLTYIVQRSTNLTTWTDLQTNGLAAQNGTSFTNTAVIISLTDTNPVSPAAYYRLKWQP